MPRTQTAYQNIYTGKLYAQESLCLREEFATLRKRAQAQLDGFLLHYNASNRTAEKFSDLWDTLKTMRDTADAFEAARQRENLEKAENVVALTRATSPADTLRDPAKEAASNE